MDNNVLEKTKPSGNGRFFISDKNCQNSDDKNITITGKIDLVEPGDKGKYRKELFKIDNKRGY